jgi:hypothetical protein
VTIRDCGPESGIGRLESLWLNLADGRGARLDVSNPDQPLRLTPRPAGELRGRLVYRGAGIRALLAFNGDRTRSRADGTFTYRRFPVAEIVATLSLELGDPDDRWTLVNPVVVRFGPGTSTDLGDLELRPLPGVKVGKIGVVFGGPGVEPVVTEVVVGLPAHQAGLRQGDLIVEVDGVAIQTVPEAMGHIGGEPGSSVRLKIRRGLDFLLFDVVRVVKD